MSQFGNPADIVKEIAVLREGSNGWKQELNLVSWNGKSPKYDIRWWSKDRTKGGKGATLRAEELLVLRNVLANIAIDTSTVG